MSQYACVKHILQATESTVTKTEISSNNVYKFLLLRSIQHLKNIKIIYMLTLKHNSLFPILIMVPYIRMTEDISEASYCYYSKRTGGLTNDSCCSIPFLSKWSLVAERKN